MKYKLTAYLLAVLMVAQVIAPQAAWASGNNFNPENKQDLVKVGELDTKSYPKLDNKTILAIQKQAREKQKTQKRKPGAGFFSVDNPYLPGQNPTDEEKAVAYGKVHVNFKTTGLNDNGTEKEFQWKEIFGVDSNGNPTNAKIHFIQRDAKTKRELGRYTLLVNKGGEYKWLDTFGKEALLPLYSDKLEAYEYDASLDYQISDKVKLLTMEMGTTNEKSTFKKDEKGRNVATIPLKLELGQVASTKFESEWKASLDENSRPQVEGLFDTKNKDLEGVEIENLIAFPKNNTDSIQLRNNNYDPDNPPDLPYDQGSPGEFRNVPEVKVVQGLKFANEDDIEGTPTYNIDEDNKTITSLEDSSIKYKFKYDFTYDVIKGGKLTMTEIIPVTFDANGGKFKNFTAPDTETKIVKEVEYDGTLIDKAENPTKDRETFKGWSTTEDGKNPVTDNDLKNIKEAKILYAIWDNNDIVADQLTVHESFKDGTGYVNDFIPTLKTLKEQVKIKDASGTPQALADDDTLQILDDSGNPIADADLKDKLYEKLKEDDGTEVSRKVTLKARVTHKNKTTQDVDIPIKVIKNIYEAKTLTKKPFYVPDGYVKVTLDPTTKAQDPQKTYYYVNPNAKVVIPGKHPIGVKEQFTRWTTPGDEGKLVDYKLADRHQFNAETTITAQYEQGKVNIKYVDENGNEIADDYHIVGVDYPAEKFGKLNAFVGNSEVDKKGPKFNGYIARNRNELKTEKYKNSDPIDTITYPYTKKVTTEDKSKKDTQYFPVIFDANGGKFGAETQKTVYVAFNGNDSTLEKVTFAELREAVEKAYGKPSKTNENFLEWQDKAAEGTKVADDYEIQFKGWDSTTYSAKKETFYAHYEKASALVKYLDLDGKPIADDFKIDGVEYPTEKTGKLDEAIASDVFTKDTAPKLIGYKFNRIEINPVNSKYALDNKGTIKIYYEKLPDVIPAKDGSGNPNEKPDGYVEVKFVPTDKAKDITEKIFYVNPKKDVTIPIANPEAKATYTFKEWKMGADAKGAAYTPSTAQKFTEATTVITATYEETKNIIPYDPSVPDPTVRPEGYVRVTFAAETGLKLTEQKAYYVKKNAGIKLGNAELVKPGYEAQTGYKFDKWDKEDSLVIEAADIVVTAKATKRDTVIPEKTGETTNKKPEGYKEVIFKIKDDDKTKGSIAGVAKFYVNPTEYVTINPPATKAETGFEFSAWDNDATRPTVYDKDTTITGSFNELKAVIPKTNPDGTENNQPKGYKTVTFVIDPKTGGKIADKEITVYYVNPAKDVTVPQPKTKAGTGYEFEKWDQDTTKKAKKYAEDTTVKGNFKKLDDIIPGNAEDGMPNAKPDGYVTVVFQKGKHGKLSGQTVYYVNPNANKKVGDLKEPEVIPDDGYRFDKWLTGKNIPIGPNDWIKIQASYKEIADVIPEKNEDGTPNAKPEGYITVTFDKGDHGKELTGQAVYYVNPNKAVVLKAKAPTAVPNTGFTFADWDTSITKAIQYKDNDVIKAKYNPIGAVIPKINDDTKKPAGYVTVTFDKGTNGKSIAGTTVYYVDPNKEVTVPAPTVKPETGWKQKDGSEAWNGKLTQTFTKDTTITAQYDSIDNIVPQKNTDGSDKPNGYVTVTFDKGNHGKDITGQTVYYVNPTKKVKLTAPTVTPEVGWKQKANGDAWDKALEDTFASDTKITAQYEELKGVIPKTTNDESEKPDGYVTVKLIPTEKATAETKAEKIYFVNPKKEVTITYKPEGKKETKSGIEYTYHFNGWTVTRGTIASWTDENIKGTFKIDTEITAKYTMSADWRDLFTPVEPKDNVVTPKDVTPKPEDLIGNPFDPNDPDNKNNLPRDIEITYKEQPKVDSKGKTTAKVEVKYPNGKTVVVEVPITVVDNVVPQTGTDKPNVPADYVKVTFVIDPAGGGKIVDKEITTYYVNPAKEVTVSQPKTKADTGYSFAGWNPNTAQATKYERDTTVKGSFTKGTDIIPSTNDQGQPNTKPEGYVTVTFDKGANGSLDGKTVYYVNPNANKTLADVTHPTIKPNTGFTENGWDKGNTTPIKGDITVTAQYDPIADVIPEKNDDGSKNNKPDGYITVTFEKGAHGTLQGTTVFYLNPNKAVALSDKAPTIIPDKGYSSAGWNVSINKAIQYKDGDKITARYNDPGNISSTEVAGYVKVEFQPGNHGTLSGTTNYWIKPDVKVTIPEPTVKPDADFRFVGWNQSLTVNLPAGSETYAITAQYSAIPYDPDVDPGLVETQIGKLPTKEDYDKQIKVSGGTFTVLEIVDQPDVSSKGLKTAKVRIKITSGGKTTTKVVDVRVYVVPDPKIIEKPVPGDCNNGCDQSNLGKGALNTTDHYQYLIGYPDGNFAPNKGMTRAEVATMFTRLLKERPVKWKHYNAGLSDIRPGDWYADTVGYAVQKGIVSGYPDGSFKPNKPITRAEFASIASRFDALAQGNAIAFSDLAPSHWGYRAIGSAASKGWISGYPDNTFRPEQAITRAEVTSVTNRMLNRYADLYWIDAHRAEIIRFGDVKRSDWYFEPIMEATMGHDFIRDRDGKTEHWTGVNGKSFI